MADPREMRHAVEDAAIASMERLHVGMHEDLAEHSGAPIQCTGRSACVYFERACNRVKHELSRIV